ncbi:hypothetical protein NL676_021459 [Syzygium grande]|nr:hypothetical protein NL676_021459 [Syzygium grande]
MIQIKFMRLIPVQMSKWLKLDGGHDDAKEETIPGALVPPREEDGSWRRRRWRSSSSKAHAESPAQALVKGTPFLARALLSRCTESWLLRLPTPLAEAEAAPAPDFRLPGVVSGGQRESGERDWVAREAMQVGEEISFSKDRAGNVKIFT